ncbi:putative endopeptidase [Altererythrobacter atlanticus]|uniref:Neutral endopeptidase n=1 Tax=Croceibacterium atlanticum TaxID=1267766 RepID=A0A0F7KV73_9SPHN|nr:M13 family metallopeptidase [Croceibacterium atlanticum]AKH43132.1 Neutral endopeptidase [Croceibacterium atlanticum]MBB5732164.1 putative endopeptidase [Croceibacterium atlanticum]
MIRKMLAAGVSAAALAIAIPAYAQEEERIPTPTMDFGTWGFDPAEIDQQVDPGDDFFAYANGKWVRENPIPAEFTRFGAFNILREKSTADVEALVSDLVKQDPAPGTAGRRIVDAYQSYLDTDAIDAAGLAPAQPYLAEIFAAQDLNALVRIFPKAGLPSLISAGVTVDSKDPDSYIVSIGFDGMGLPDRDYYLVDNERNLEIRQRYKEYLTFLLGKAGYQDPAAAAESVYAFEHKVAQLEWDRTALRNRDITYNKLTRDDLLALAPEFPTALLLDAAGFSDQGQFLAPQIPPGEEEAAELELSRETLEGIGGGTPAMMKLVSATPLATLKAYMAAQFLSAHASVLPSEFDDANFAFYGKFLNGQEEQRPRWKRAIAAAESQLGEQLGALYVERYFPPESKAAMDALVKNLRKALAVSIEENDWMTPETKEQAIAKLDSFNPKIGYPDEFETYDGLEIKAGDALGNRIRATEWAIEDNRSKLGQPVDRSEWGMLPQTVNAYYNPVFNEIVFPAAILQPPFFNPDADPAVNYGGIGAVIGHEMGHGFDDQGAKSDATGTLRNWWQPADLAQFTELGDKLAAQYDAYCPYDNGDTCVNGRFTLGENIGDNGGLSLAYRAYRMSLDGKEAPVIDGLTGDQRFFLAWAQVWRSAQREAAGRQRLMTDPHSPEEFRTNGAVRNQDAWYEAFKVEPGDDLYLAPEDRVRIW